MKTSVLVIGSLLITQFAAAAPVLHCDIIESIAGDFTGRSPQEKRYSLISKLDAPGIQRITEKGQLVTDFSIDGVYFEKTAQAAGNVMLTVFSAGTKENPLGSTATTDSFGEPARVMLGTYSAAAGTSASIKMDCKVVETP